MNMYFDTEEDYLKYLIEREDVKQFIKNSKSINCLYILEEEINKMQTEILKKDRFFIGTKDDEREVFYKIWEMLFEEVACRDYRANTSNKCSDKIILELYEEAFVEKHRYCLYSVISEFKRYIELINLVSTT